jgi:hypothetical protein
MRRADGWTFFQFALRFYSSHGPVAPGTVDLWREYQGWKESEAGQKSRRSGLIGSPETLRRKLHRFEESNIDQVILLNQAGNNTHEDICSSLELFAREVMPEFHAREPAHQAWKRAVLQREIELPEVDVAAFAAPNMARPTLAPEAAAR